MGGGGGGGGGGWGGGRSVGYRSLSIRDFKYGH